MHSFLTETKIRILLIIAGVLTSSMLLITLAPVQYFPLFFAIDISPDIAIDNNSELLVFVIQSWSFLIFMLGMGLIVSAFNKRFRLTCVLFAGFSKVFFVSLILLNSELVLPGFLLTVVVDSIFGLLLLGLGLFGVTNNESDLFSR